MQLQHILMEHATQHGHGFTLRHAPCLHKITAEMAEQRLRDVVFSRWRTAACESYEDTLKLVSLVDFFLPFLPLERRHVRELIVRELGARGQALLRKTKVALAWRDEVVDFLTDKVSGVMWHGLHSLK